MHKTFLLLILAAILPACGLKGPLYLPQQKPVAAPPAAASSNTQVDDEKKSPGSK